jgi:hypothetical protein
MAGFLFGLSHAKNAHKPPMLTASKRPIELHSFMGYAVINHSQSPLKPS